MCVCVSVLFVLFCFAWIFFFKSGSIVLIFIFVGFLWGLLFLGFCFEREKDHKVWWVGRWGGSGSSWGGEKQDVYMKTDIK